MTRLHWIKPPCVRETGHSSILNNNKCHIYCFICSFQENITTEKTEQTLHHPVGSWFWPCASSPLKRWISLEKHRIQSCILYSILWRLFTYPSTSRLLGAVTMSSVKHAVRWCPTHDRSPSVLTLHQNLLPGLSPSLRQHNPRRNWCQNFCQVISLGNHIASRCDTRRAWWGLWLAPLLSRCPGTPGDAPLAAWDHQHGVALLARPGLCYLYLQRWAL